MSIDLSHFIPTFLEESFEGLAVMESGLLDFDTQEREQINTIFRAAHSIKGGAGTFGFEHITAFTHVVETLLDEVRSDERPFSAGLQTLLLKSVDCTRMMLEAARDEVDYDRQSASAVLEALTAELNRQPATADAELASKPSMDEVSPISEGWQIGFVPSPHLLMTGNEPILMMSALHELGRVEIEVSATDLPYLEALDPEALYLSWDIKVFGACTEADILEVFEWVADDCDIVISPLSSSIKETVTTPVVSLPMTSEVDCSTADTLPDTAVNVPSPTTSVVPLPMASEVDGSTTDTLSDAGVNVPSPLETQKNCEPVISNTDAVTHTRSPSADVSSVRVGIDKIDGLINRVGELVITQSMLSQVGYELADYDLPATARLLEGLAQLERNTRDLQEEVMRVRMLPISSVFNRFPRMVHDVSSQLQKKVTLKLSGEQTELDKTVMEKIGDPLVHLVRNALDHGLESPQARLAAGKDETGTVHLNAYHQGGYIVIEVKDDGCGLDTQRIREKAVEKGLILSDQVLTEADTYDLIFQAGFSTVTQVSDLSGRGVGMDVVRKNIESLGGHVTVQSTLGQGATFTVSLPLTLAILDGQLVQIHHDVYVVPLISIIESIQVHASQLQAIGGESYLLHFREEYIPIIHLQRVFNLAPVTDVPEKTYLIVVVEGAGMKVGLVVDELQSQQQVVIKSLEANYKRVEGISGATILGDGAVALILDVIELIKMGLEPTVRREVTLKNEQLRLAEEGTKV